MSIRRTLVNDKRTWSLYDGRYLFVLKGESLKKCVNTHLNSFRDLFFVWSSKTNLFGY